jgi:hypothetical protein
MRSIEVKRRLVSFVVFGVWCVVAAPSRRAAAGDLPPPTPEATAVSSTAAGVPPPPSSPPPPYSLPWQLRPVAPATALRVDSSVAFYQNAMGASGDTEATMLLGSYKLTPNLAPLVRFGVVTNDVPAASATASDGSSFINPIVGLTYGRRVNALRWAAFGGVTIPIGMGSGDHPDVGAATANKAGIAARSAMDNAMFAVNYFTAIVGGDLAYVDHKVTLQAEATLFQLLRVHGDDAGSASTDSARANSTFGIHAGYFLLPYLSLGAELRYQRWLSRVTQLNTMGARVDIPDANKDTTTVAIGPRAHFSIGRGIFLRPGLSYARALDQPLSGQSYDTLQVDVPVVF